MHKILIVDDDKDILDTVASLLDTKFSSDAQKATNGLDAFLMCMKEEFDLIITDQKMPFMTGAAFIIATRTKKESKNKSTPIIMLSGFIDDELRKNLGIQNVRFLTKPFQSSDLFDLVRDYLL